MSELKGMRSFIGDKVAEWAHRNDPIGVLGRADPQEFANETNESRRRIIKYSAGLAICSILVESDNQLVRGVAKAGAVVSGLSAWNNASKVLLYGRGPSEQQTQRVREMHPEFIPPESTKE